VLDGGAGRKARARIPNAKEGVKARRRGERGLAARAKAGGLDRGGVACFCFVLWFEKRRELSKGGRKRRRKGCGATPEPPRPSERKKKKKRRKGDQKNERKKREGGQTRLKLVFVCTLRRVNGVLSI
jgi:hypothetical protein